MENKATKDQEFDISFYVRVLLKRKWTILSIFIILVLIVSIYSFRADPIYKATARVLIERENPNLVSIEEVMGVTHTGLDYYLTQYQIIESRSVAREVADRLNLIDSKEFFPAPKEDFISDIRSWFSNTMNFWKKMMTQLLNPGSLSDIGRNGNSEDLAENKLVDALIKRISVSPIEDSRLVDVSAEAKDPKMAARIANEVVRAYIDQDLATKLKAAQEAVKWLTARIDEERRKVEEAENALLQYKETNKIITDFSSDSESITAEKLAQLNQSVVTAEAERVEAETRYRQALALSKEPETLDSIPEVLNNELIKEIKKIEVNLYKKISELSKKYGRKHPQMIAIQSELEDLQMRKMAEAQRVVESLRSQYRLALAKEKSLKEALAEQKSESLEMNRKAIQYGVLQRQAESSRHMYELLIKRFKETSLTEEMKTGNIRIIDEAEVPIIPIKPRKKRNIMVAMAMGLMLGIGVSLLLEYMDNTFKHPDEVKEFLGIPYLGPIPIYDSKEKKSGKNLDLITLHSPKSTASESFRGLRTAILFSSADTSPQVMLVTSATPSEGKTSCVTNLAITMAEAGSKVILIDCDMRRPRVHRVLKSPAADSSVEKGREIGVSSFLVGNTKQLSDVVFHTEIKNLDFIPSGPIPPNPSEIIGSRKMEGLIEYLRKRYDRILIDSPPITAVTDSVVLAQMADGLLLVIRAGETPRQIVKNALDQLKNVNAHVIGAVLNAVNMGRDSYYYYQYYYYYYGDDGQKKKNQRKSKRSGAY